VSEWEGFNVPINTLSVISETSLFSQSTCTGTDNLTRTTKRQNTQITQNNTTQKLALVNSTTDTPPKKYRLRKRTDRAWFSHLVRQTARKRSGSVLTTPEHARGTITFETTTFNMTHLLAASWMWCDACSTSSDENWSSSIRTASDVPNGLSGSMTLLMKTLTMLSGFSWSGDGGPPINRSPSSRSNEMAKQGISTYCRICNQNVAIRRALGRAHMFDNSGSFPRQWSH